jgi:hypothetical protein
VYNLKEGTLQGYVVAINTDEKNHATITDWQVGITVSATPPTGGLETFGRIERQEGAAIVPSRDGISAYRNYGILDGATYRAIISGKKRIYVFGKAKYNGVDGESHLTVFCYIFYGSETSHRHDGYDAPQAKYCEAPYNEAR